MAQYGTEDKSLSNYHHAWIKQGGDSVVGIIGEGTSKELVINWKSPFADSGLAAKYGKVEGLLQALTSTVAGVGAVTMISTLNSTLTWEGNDTTLSLVLRLYAQTNAKAEVVDAIKALERMAAPELTGFTTGRTPGSVSINIGRLAIYTECAITGITIPLDKEKTRDGYLVRADVNIQLKPTSIINRSKINDLYG